jgi:hypothetical protein
VFLQVVTSAGTQKEWQFNSVHHILKENEIFVHIEAAGNL